MRSEEDFQTVFKTTKDEFLKYPQWKQVSVAILNHSFINLSEPVATLKLVFTCHVPSDTPTSIKYLIFILFF